jgi:hypothetical protein
MHTCQQDCYMFRQGILQTSGSPLGYVSNTLSYINLFKLAQARRSRVRFPIVIGIFHWHNPSFRAMALGLTQPLTEMIARNNSGVKAAVG